TADRKIDRAAARLRHAPDNREISARERTGAAMVCKLFRELAVRLVRFGNDEQPARVLVEAMHDAGALLAADAREARPAMGDQRINKRSFFISRGGMDDESGGLVDDDQLVVLEDDIEGNVLAFGPGGLRHRHVQLDAIAGFDPVCGVSYRLRVHADFALKKELLQARAAEFARVRGKEAVEPFARVL